MRRELPLGCRVGMSPIETNDDSPSIDETTGLPTDTTLDDVDIFVIDHEDLDELIKAFGGPSAVPEALTIFTDDEFTRNSFEFNLIAFDEALFDDRPYGIATQLHNPMSDPADVVAKAYGHYRPDSFETFLEALR